MMKRCKCLPADRKASFMTLNGESIYMCKKCGRYHNTRTLPKHWDLSWLVVIGLAWLLLAISLFILGK